MAATAPGFTPWHPTSGRGQVAIVHFLHLPTRVGTLEFSDQLTIDVHPSLENI